MESRFAALAGNALKKPVLEVLNERGPLNAQTFEGPSEVRAGTLYLKNIGDRTSEPISVWMFCSHSVFQWSGAWEQVGSLDKEFPNGYRLSGHAQGAIAAGETWTLADPLTFYVDRA